MLCQTTESIFSFSLVTRELFVTKSICELAKNEFYYLCFRFQKVCTNKTLSGWPIADLTTIFPLKTDLCLTFFNVFRLHFSKIQPTWRDETVRKQGRKWINTHNTHNFFVIANVNIWTISIINPNIWTLMGLEMNFMNPNIKIDNHNFRTFFFGPLWFKNRMRKKAKIKNK